MDWFVKNFLKAAVAWLILGGLAGLAMAAYPAWTVYRAAHTHMLLLGFVTMMIFGVGYHVIPRFAGAPIRDRRAPTAHWWLANGGLALMVIGFVMRASGSVAVATWILSTGGVLTGLGMVVFAFVVWRTLDRPPPAVRAFLLSFLITGAGQMYAGETGRGITMLLMSAVGAGVYLNALTTQVNCASYSYSSCDSSTGGLALAGVGLWVGTWIYSMADAGPAVRRYNASRGLTAVARQGPHGTTQLGLSIALR
jgi:hypothetical protein